MKALLLSGLLYLLGISIILYFRPALMFKETGEWKEFGIGRDREDFTPFPFWMFVFIWAIVSYIIVRIILRLVDTFDTVPMNTITRSNTRGVQQEELVPGYYILNAAATKRGAPRYVYYGKEPPMDF
jgi:hypothetical protein